MQTALSPIALQERDGNVDGPSAQLGRGAGTFASLCTKLPTAGALLQQAFYSCLRLAHLPSHEANGCFWRTTLQQHSRQNQHATPTAHQSRESAPILSDFPVRNPEISPMSSEFCGDHLIPRRFCAKKWDSTFAACLPSFFATPGPARAQSPAQTRLFRVSRRRRSRSFCRSSRSGRPCNTSPGPRDASEGVVFTFRRLPLSVSFLAMLGCYWVGSLDVSCLGKQGGFH